MNKIILWSRRWTTARGWRWESERTCSGDEAEQWLAVFQKDEPDIEFVLAYTKPKTTNNCR